MPINLPNFLGASQGWGELPNLPQIFREAQGQRQDLEKQKLANALMQEKLQMSPIERQMKQLQLQKDKYLYGELYGDEPQMQPGMEGIQGMMQPQQSPVMQDDQMQSFAEQLKTMGQPQMQVSPMQSPIASPDDDGYGLEFSPQSNFRQNQIEQVYGLSELTNPDDRNYLSRIAQTPKAQLSRSEKLDKMWMEDPQLHGEIKQISPNAGREVKQSDKTGLTTMVDTLPSGRIVHRQIKTGPSIREQELSKEEAKDNVAYRKELSKEYADQRKMKNILDRMGTLIDSPEAKAFGPGYRLEKFLGSKDTKEFVGQFNSLVQELITTSEQMSGRPSEARLKFYNNMKINPNTPLDVVRGQWSMLKDLHDVNIEAITEQQNLAKQGYSREDAQQRAFEKIDSKIAELDSRREDMELSDQLKPMYISHEYLNALKRANKHVSEEEILDAYAKKNRISRDRLKIGNGKKQK